LREGLAVRELEKPIGRVFRRLRVQRFLSAFVWALAGWLAAATVVLAVDKLATPLPGPDWLPFAIAGGGAFLVALFVAIFSGPSRVDAAVAIDRAFGLNERLSTTLTLPEDMKATPAGRALMTDTLKHVADLDVADRFGLKMPRRAWAPLIPAALACLFVFAPEWAQKIVKANSSSSTETKIDREIVSKKSEALKDKIAAQRKDMDKAKFAEADKLLAEVEKAANELAKAPPAEKDKAMMALNKLTEAVKDRQRALGSPEQMNRQLQGLKEANGSDGPASEFMKDLAKGNFDKAAKDLKKLQEKMAAGKMTEPEKKALKEQLQSMSKQLQQMANLDERKKQLDKAKQSGNLSQEQYNKEMQKLDQQKQNLQNLQKLAEQLNKAGEQMSKGDMKKAAEQLGMSQKEMEQMAQQMQELQSLDSALADLQDAKDGMNGSDKLNQFGEGMDQFNMGKNQNRMGRGGRGQGQGARPEAEDDVAMYSTKSKGQVGKGKAVLEGFAPPSKQVKGQSIIPIQGEAPTTEGNASDALSNQKVPRSVEKHVRSYMDQLNKGQ
jgi:hypothetical protein